MQRFLTWYRATPKLDIALPPGEIVLRPNVQVLCREVKDGAVLIHLETNQIYDLNQTGYRIWQLLHEGLDYAAIRGQIEQEFDVDPSRLMKELDGLIAHLSAERLLEEEKDVAGPAA